MLRSEDIKDIAPALLKAQRAIGAAKKDAINPFFKAPYADLGAVMEACKQALNDNEIVVLQPVGTDERGTYVETILLHSSGQYIADRMMITPKEDHNPQAQGSAISYARRYGLQSMLFIPAEDDDGEKASAKPVAKPTRLDPIRAHIATLARAPSVQKAKEPAWICEECTQEIKKAVIAGIETEPGKIAQETKGRIGKQLCYECYKKLKPKTKATIGESR